MINKFGERLSAARKMAGLSLDALAQRAGAIVTKQAISKYEKGMIKPGSDVLLALANALNVKVDFFFRASNIDVEGIEFRKRSRLAKKEEDRVKYKTIEFVQKYLEIEEILGLTPSFKNPVTQNYVKNYEDIEKAAAEIRKKWKLGNGPVPNLIELLEDKGFKIFEMDADEQFDGLSGFVEGKKIPVIAIFKKSEPVRKRFTIAHELGHLLLEFPEAKKESPEKLCHAFAGALLLPREVMIEELWEKRSRITEWELMKIRGLYGVSMQAIMARAFHLGIITANVYRQFNIFVNKNGWRKSEPGVYEGIEEANRFKQLVMYAAAEQIISFSKGAELFNQSLGEFEKEVRVVS
ncbi:MAG: ImmA/IrrE family metallo-endopeptidase [Deltaproteobacteria bacterium]|nr:ImmA/IrrE family metallo-endopeptidase [Deltaproteobacteria bacterium]